MQLLRHTGIQTHSQMGLRTPSHPFLHSLVPWPYRKETYHDLDTMKLCLAWSCLSREQKAHAGKHTEAGILRETGNWARLGPCTPIPLLCSRAWLFDLQMASILPQFQALCFTKYGFL